MSEAEIQVLIALIELSEPKETPNNNFYRPKPANFEQAATYFRKYREDYTEAYRALESQQLVDSAGDCLCLTTSGRALAEHWRDARPPIWYWYKEFYTDAQQSPTYREFCERLYGRYLCQQSFSDMGQIDAMLHQAKLSASSRVLDLGCGAGMLAEYVSDTTGAYVHGLDYSPDAITLATQRTVAKRHRLTFEVGNMDSLELPLRSFDTAFSVDTLYMPRSLTTTLTRVGELLVPDGQMLAFYSDDLPADQTPLAAALGELGLPYHIIDYSRETYELMQLKTVLAEELEERFKAEERSYLYEHLRAEAAEPGVPYDPAIAGPRRYLYHVRLRLAEGT
jgi:SAM-dependent methyltransferase